MSKQNIIEEFNKVKEESKQWEARFWSMSEKFDKLMDKHWKLLDKLEKEGE